MAGGSKRAIYLKFVHQLKAVVIVSHRLDCKSERRNFCQGSGLCLVVVAHHLTLKNFLLFSSTGTTSIDRSTFGRNTFDLGRLSIVSDFGSIRYHWINYLYFIISVHYGSHSRTKTNDPLRGPLYKLSISLLCLPALCFKNGRANYSLGSRVSYFNFFIHIQMFLRARPGYNLFHVVISAFMQKNNTLFFE